jgi:hypothetical protein
MTPEELRNRASHYRTMADGVMDPRAVKALRELADEYEALAREMDHPPLMPGESKTH